MAEPDAELPPITAELLVGTWQCFKGDGIHGWDHRVLIFRKDGDRLIVETWLPFEKGKPIDGLRLYGTRAYRYFQKANALRLSPQDPSQPDVDISPSEDGTIVHRLPRTTAGWLWFRKTAKSIRELSG
jgi:hypothetical protein